MNVTFRLARRSSALIASAQDDAKTRRWRAVASPIVWKWWLLTPKTLQRWGNGVGLAIGGSWWENGTVVCTVHSQSRAQRIVCRLFLGTFVSTVVGLHNELGELTRDKSDEVSAIVMLHGSSCEYEPISLAQRTSKVSLRGNWVRSCFARFAQLRGQVPAMFLVASMTQKRKQFLEALPQKFGKV